MRAVLEKFLEACVTASKNLRCSGVTGGLLSEGSYAYPGFQRKLLRSRPAFLARVGLALGKPGTAIVLILS